MRLRYRTLSALFSFALVFFALPTFSRSPSFTASPHPLHFWDYHGRTQTQATIPIRPSLCPTTISRFSPNNASICCLICQAELPSTSAPTVFRLNAGVHITVNAFFCHTFRRPPSSPSITICQPILPLRTMSSSSSNNKLFIVAPFSANPTGGIRCCRACPRQSYPASSASTPSLHVSSPFCFFFKGDDYGNVASTPPYLRGYWRSRHGVRTLGIVLQNILIQLSRNHCRLLGLGRL